MKPLVSILIPAYNAEDWIADTIQSAIAQTWPRTEIIIVDDGSRDRTAEAARRFKSKKVAVVSTLNQGPAAARNHAYQLSQGDYIQWLDADDLLAPDKIECQLRALDEHEGRRILLSSPWAPFYYRTRGARFVHNSLCQDLTPIEWLLRKLAENIHMQTATWLTSRNLADAAGPWDTRLHVDDDGEYFCRVLICSEGTRFVPDARVFYRVTSSNRVSHIGTSDKKKESMLLSMKLHIQYIRSLAENERVRNACLKYLQNWYYVFYPDRPDLVAEVQALALQLQGRLEVPALHRKYAWIKPILGSKAAKTTQVALPRLKTAFRKHCDRVMYRLESRPPVRSRGKNYAALPARLKSYLKLSEFVVGLVRAFRGLRLDLRVLLGLIKRRGQIADYLKHHRVRKLQIGTSNNVIDGWLNTDTLPNHSSVVYLDATRRFPFAAHTFDYIMAEHMIEHIDYQQAQTMLRECFRVLKPGGLVRFATPDLEVLLNLRSQQQNAAATEYVNWTIERYMPETQHCKEVILINNAFRAWGHCFLYDGQTLQHALKTAGFSDINFYKPGTSGDPELMNLEIHGREIQSEDINRFETIVVEGRKRVKYAGVHSDDEQMMKTSGGRQ